MPEDASLDDFLEGGEDSADSDADEGEAVSDEPESGTDEPESKSDREPPESQDGGATESDDVETDATHEGDDSEPLATTTYAWSDEGTTCEECGAPAERRWQQDGALVCPDCKVW